MRIYPVLFIILITSNFANAQSSQKLSNKKVILPNGWQLSPAGRSLQLGDLPLNMAVSASQKLLAVTNNGQSTQSIQLINIKTEKILTILKLQKAGLV